MVEINLLSGSLIGKQKTLLKPFFLYSCITIMLCLGGMHCWIAQKNFQEKNKIDNYREKLLRIHFQYEEIAKLNNQIKSLFQIIQLGKKMQKEQYAMTYVFYKMSHIIPPNISFFTIKGNKDVLLLEGQSNNILTIHLFLKAFNSAKLIKIDKSVSLSQYNFSMRIPINEKLF